MSQFRWWGLSCSEHQLLPHCPGFNSGLSILLVLPRSLLREGNTYFLEEKSGQLSDLVILPLLQPPLAEFPPLLSLGIPHFFPFCFPSQITRKDYTVHRTRCFLQDNLLHQPSMPYLSLRLAQLCRCVKYQEICHYLSYKKVQSRTWSDTCRIYVLGVTSEAECTALAQSIPFIPIVSVSQSTNCIQCRVRC